MIDLTFEFKRDYLTLPINPENIEISEPGDNKKANVVGLGEIVIPGERGLASFQINSFFPDDAELEFFQTWRESKQPAHFTADGLNIDMDVVIDEFSYDRRSGEENRVYYKLDLSEYRPYGARIVVMPTATTALPMVAQRTSTDAPTSGKTYIVKAGDTLWGLAKRFSDKNGTDWAQIYELNKALIGSDPNRLMVGWELTMPTVWNLVTSPASFGSGTVTQQAAARTGGFGSTRAAAAATGRTGGFGSTRSRS